MAKRLKPKYLGPLVLLGLLLLAACTASVERDTPTPPPSPTSDPEHESAVSACGGPIERSEVAPLTAFYPQNDGYVWVLPDGTDANVGFENIIASDPNATDSTRLSFPIWSRPAVSPDLMHSAMTVQRRLFSSSADTRTIVVLSDADSPVRGMFELPGDGAQSLVQLSWLSESGCLAVLHFTSTHEQGLYLLQNSGEVVAQFQPTLARGSILEVSTSGWIVLDRLALDNGEIELFSIENSGTTILIGADDIVPGFLGLTDGIQTAEQFVADLRN